MTHVVATVQSNQQRFRNDDGSQTTATWKAATNTNATIPINQIFRVRIGISETAGAADSTTNYVLQYNRNGGGWVDAATNPHIALVTSPNVTDGTATTQQITSGSFQAGEISTDGTTASITLGASTSTEVEFVVRMVFGQAATNDTYQFRVTRNGTVLAAYNNVPTVTASAAPFEIYDVVVTPTTTGANVTWKTTVAASSQLEYGPTTSYGNFTTKQTSLVTTHSDSITDASPGDTVHLRAKSQTSGDAETALSGDFEVVVPSIAFRSHSIVAPLSGSTSWTLDKPSGLTVGDLMLAIIHQRTVNADTWGKPTGWTELASVAINTTTALFWKIADSNDVAASGFAFNHGATGGIAMGGILAFEGANTAPFPDGYGTTSSSGEDATVAQTASVVGPNVVGVAGGMYLLLSSAVVGTISWSDWSNGGQEIYDINTGASSGVSGAVASWYIGSSGTYTGQTATASATMNGHAISLAIAPAPVDTGAIGGEANTATSAKASTVNVARPLAADADTASSAKADVTVTTPPAGTPPIDTLVDTFDGTTIDGSKWPEVYGTPTQNDELILTPKSNYADTVISASYDARDGIVAIEVTQTPNVGNGTIEAQFQLRATGGGGGVVGFLMVNGWMAIGVNSAIDDTTWAARDPDEKRWLRFRTVSTTDVYFETSPDGATWTTYAHKTGDFAWLASAQVLFNTGYYGTESSPGEYRIDNVNSPPVQALEGKITASSSAVATLSGGTGLSVLFADNFNRTPGIVADDTSYTQGSGTCPYYGTDNATGWNETQNPGGLWRSDSSDAIIVSDGAGGGVLTGDPTGWSGNKFWFRTFLTPNEVTFDLSSKVYMSWRAKQSAYGLNEPGNIVGGDGADVWFGYHSQYNLYTIHFFRQDNRFTLKRKVPDCSNSSNNYGMYYTLQFDEDSPAAGGWAAVGWANLPQGTKDAIAAAEGRAWSDTLATDGTNTTGTWYDFTLTLEKINTRDIKIQLFRAGVLVGSWTDSPTRASDNYHCATHGFLQDYQAHHTTANGHWDPPAEWMRQPLGDRPGSSGFRADNVQVWIDDFSVTSFAPSGVEQDLDGKGASASGASGSLGVTRSLAGSSAGANAAPSSTLLASRSILASTSASSSAQGTVSVTRSIASSVSASSSAQATVSPIRSLASSFSAAATSSATLSTTRSLTGAAVTAVSAQATLSVDRSLTANTPASASAAAPTIDLLRPVAGSMADANQSSATLHALRPLATSLSAAAEAAAELTRTGDYSGALAIAGSASGLLDVSLALGGVATAASGASALPSIDRSLASTTADAASAAGTIETVTELQIAGATSASAAASGSLSLAVALDATVGTAGGANASMALSVALTGAMDAAAHSVGTFGAVVGLDGSLSGAGSAVASLSVDRPLSSAATGSADATAALSASRPLVGSIPSAADAESENLLLLLGLSASASVAAVAEGTITVDRGLSAGAPISAEASGALITTSETVLNGSVVGASTASGALTLAVGLVGAAPSSASLRSIVQLELDLSGSLSASATGDGALTTVVPLAAVAPAACGAYATPQVVRLLVGTSADAVSSLGTLRAEVALAGRAPSSMHVNGLLLMDDVTIYGYVMRAGGLRPFTEAFIMVDGQLERFDFIAVMTGNGPVTPEI